MSALRPLFRRRGDTMTSITTTSSSHSRSSSSSDDDDLDAITPCPPHSQPNAWLEQLERAQQTDDEQQPTHPHHHHRRPSVPRRRTRPTSWRSTLSSSDDEEPDAVDPSTLWRRMLALQRRFGCYNSARMRAALELDGGEEDAVPSQTCLDLLNDSIDTLPEEERQRLEAFLESAGAGGKGYGKVKRRRSWRERLLLPGTARGA